MTQISTSLRVTRESARLIRSQPTGTIAATNIQDALAELAAESLAALTTPTLIAATGAIPAAAINVQTQQVAPITLTVPDSIAWALAYGKYGIPLTIFDASGTASTNAVTLNFTGGQTLDGIAAPVINSDFGGFRLQPLTGGGWIMV